MEYLTLTEKLKELLKDVIEHISTEYRRIFMGKVVNSLGPGGQRKAERELGWNRETIRKGQRELDNGKQIVLLSTRGRKKAEEHFPNLL